MKDLNPTQPSTLLRAAGLLLILIGIFTFDENSTLTTHTLWLPLMMALGAGLALQNVLAVALAITALSGIHTNLQADDWVTARAYPTLATIGAVLIAIILTIRFRRNIAASRAARQAEREARRQKSEVSSNS